jgi:hypothetical protein
LLQAQIFSGFPRLQLAKVDVFQYASLQGQLQGYTTLFIATGSRPGFDPFGPFNIDYQVHPWAVWWVGGCVFPEKM